MNIKLLRNVKGLSQDQLAQATGIPRGRIAAWELGKGNPKFTDLKTLEEFFKDILDMNTLEEPTEPYGTDNILININKRMQQIQFSLAQSEQREIGLAELVHHVSAQVESLSEVLQQIQDTLNRTIGVGAGKVTAQNGK